METYLWVLIIMGLCLVVYLLYKFRNKISEFICDDDYEDELKDNNPNLKENKQEEKLI